MNETSKDSKSVVKAKEISLNIPWSTQTLLEKIKAKKDEK